MRKFLLAAVLAGLVAVLGVPGVARAQTYSQWNLCDPAGLCISMNGTSGDLVYAKDPGLTGDFQIETIVQAAIVCPGGPMGLGSDLVEYDASTNTGCPFTVPRFDRDYQGDLIERIAGHDGTQDAQSIASTYSVDQSISGYGRLWVYTGSTRNLVSVNASDYQDLREFLCDAGQNQPVQLSPVSSGCSWEYPYTG